jgi:YjbE family integral membrane protein
MLEELATQVFWLNLLKIIGVNIILSGDNAVVIALAARSLPAKQQKAAVLWGSGAAVVMRIVLTIFAVALLTLPWLKLIGSLLLFWIGVKLLIPEDGDENISASDNLMAAIRTILIADLVMSIDNVIAVAAAAQGSYTLLVLGLAISIPLVIFGSTLLLTLMERWPVIITIGGGLLGFVAGEMLVTDPVLKDWLGGLGVAFDAEGKPRVGGLSLEVICGLAGAVIVIALGTLIGKRRAMKAVVHDAALEVERPRNDAEAKQPKS